MLKAIGFLLAVLAIWTTVEVYAHGTHGAFDGALVPLLGESDAPESRLSAPARAEAAVERAHQAQQERYDELLGD